MNSSDLIAAYNESKANLNKWKAEEAKLRIEVTDRFFGTESPAGTFHTHVGPWKVSGVFKNNIKLDEAEYYDLIDDLSDAENMCIKLKPTLVLGAYNKLESTPGLDQCLTVTPGMPSLTIKEIPDE